MPIPQNQPPQPQYHQHSFVLPHMNKWVVISAVLFVAGFILAWILASSKFQADKNQPKPTITITAKASKDYPADEAKLLATVRSTTTYPDRESALTDVKKQIDAVKKSLNSVGISSSSYQFTNPYAISGDFAFVGDFTGSTGSSGNPNGGYYVGDYPLPPSPIPTPQQPKSYSGTSTVTITLYKDEMKVLDTLKNTLQNMNNVQVSTPYYGIQDKTSYEDEVKYKAIANAREQATQIAKVNNSYLGKVISITDQTNKLIPSYLNTTFTSPDKNITISESYQVVYELNQNWLPF